MSSFREKWERGLQPEDGDGPTVQAMKEIMAGALPPVELGGEVVEPRSQNAVLARLVHLEERIGGAEHEGLRARWEFGHELLRARDGKGRLPNRYLATVAAQTGASRRELGYRMQFAERFSNLEELCNALPSRTSWHEMVNDVLGTPKPSAVVREGSRREMLRGSHPTRGSIVSTGKLVPWLIEAHQTRLRETP